MNRNKNPKTKEAADGVVDHYLRVHIEADDEASRGSLPIASAEVPRTAGAQGVARAAWKTVAK